MCRVEPPVGIEPTTFSLREVIVDETQHGRNRAYLEAIRADAADQCGVTRDGHATYYAANRVTNVSLATKISDAVNALEPAAFP